jgi:N-acetylglucosamine kinase-like BadF-type ATPase
MAHNSEIILAVDGGGTFTRCLAIDAVGKVRGEGHGGPANHILSPLDVVKASISEALRAAMQSAGSSTDSVACVSLGTAGIGPNGEGKEVIEDIAQELFPRAKVTATGDMVIAFHGAILTGYGVVANAGTGSVVYGVSPKGANRQVGGWGHILGDEGSAYDIAVRGLRAGARHFDGRGPFTSLVDLIPEALDVSDYIQVAFKMYGLNLSRTEIAALAKTVAAAAKAGDEISRQILTDAAGELALAVSVAVRELGMEDIAAPVSYVGSVFDSGKPLIDAFTSAVTKLYPLAVVAPPEFHAVIGAFLLGARAIGWPISPALLATLKEQCIARRYR